MKSSAFLHQVMLVLLLLIISCQSDSEDRTYSVRGYAQKGPFIAGSEVTISELDNRFIPTGRAFFATIQDNDGYFELPGVKLSSPYAQLKVEGQFYGEALGFVQGVELTLYSIVDLNHGQEINVNVITHLVKRRIEELVQVNNIAFIVAKEQAFNEFLQVFNWEKLSIQDAEKLNIFEDNTGGAVLLATSAIFDNIKDPTTRLKTLTDFQADFKDGSINSESTQRMLITSAESINRFIVYDHLEYFYGVDPLPDFEGPLDHFIDNTEFISYLDQIFPETYNGQANLVRSLNPELNSANTYYISITIPKGIESDVHLYITSVSPNENNRFITTGPEWDNLYFIGNSPCSNSPEETDFNCYQSYAMIHRVNFSDDINLQFPVTFSGSGSMTLYYQANVNGTEARKEVEFTW